MCFWVVLGIGLIIAVNVLVACAVIIAGKADDELDRRDGGNRGA